MKNYEDAIDFYTKAISLNPYFEIALFNKAICLHNIGKYLEAVDCFKRATELNPHCAETFQLCEYSRKKLADK